MTRTVEKASDTRRRLLEAAGEVFADRGFEKATIREIVERAEANLNAVNYYFRDKRGLYQALFEHAHQHAEEQDRETFAGARALPPAERLRVIIVHLLRGVILRKRAPWQVRLMAREMFEPSGVLDVMVDRLIRPRFEHLITVVGELAPPGTPELKIRLCAESIMAQGVHMSHARAVVSRLIPELAYTPEGIETMADHIVEFTLAALKNLPVEEVQR